MPNVHATDVVIVGAGPVGLFGVFECGMLKMKCHVVDTLDAIGGQCTALYPEKPIYDIPGFPRVDAGELIERLTQQAAPFGPVYHLGRTVTELRSLDDGTFAVVLSDGACLVAKAVIVAGGGGTLGPNKPPLAGIDRYEGRHVLYRVNRLEELRGRRVVVAGGGDSAVDWALALAGIAEHVMLVHRRLKFRAAPASVEALHTAEREGRLELVAPYQLHALEGDGHNLHGITVRTEAGEERLLKADVLLALFGIATELGPIAGWNLALEHQQIRTHPGTSETNRPGVYAAGDISSYPGKLKLILTGFAEIAAAAHHIFPRVHPGEVLHLEHSTTVGVPPMVKHTALAEAAT
ncbi:MAG TPA: NAD(P)/FAD-dependent oxidoreductase [Ramlibacter sp.]|uniref:NAD(P)/FAD-dependent oxidoreductase n=1 Tax=Ramlibacter sp. TaxID=1917967 RepID=UPI002B8457CD|nr:NAD(P)/FAD-dependent oxidoreductase [Ramlibacter sp.]HVZ46561.1 NAD(P)/FAD-dependent oxidoreductase [Ramlibacter sp.]